MVNLFFYGKQPVFLLQIPIIYSFTSLQFCVQFFKYCPLLVLSLLGFCCTYSACFVLYTFSLLLSPLVFCYSYLFFRLSFVHLSALKDDSFEQESNSCPDYWGSNCHRLSVLSHKSFLFATPFVHVFLCLRFFKPLPNYAVFALLFWIFS